jgi:hypothetical protein
VIDQVLASRLLIPLWQLFPKSDDVPDYQDLITRTLAKASHDEAHAEATVERLLETCHYKPLPAEVIEAANVVATELEPAPPPEEWQPTRGPGDEPFGGLADLINDRLIELFRAKAEHGRTYAERESAKRFLQLHDERQRELEATTGSPR